MALVEKSQSYFFSSDPDNNARNISPDGDQFTVQLNESLKIPREAKHATLEVIRATIWNTSPNISEQNQNNKLHIYTGYTEIDVLLPSYFIITIPSGLYGLGELASYVQQSIVALGFPPNMITFSASEAQGKVIISYRYNTKIDFTKPDSPIDILGFNARQSPPITDDELVIDYADKVAQFNYINSYLIKSDIISGGIPVNSISDSVIADVPITASPGSQIVYQSLHPIKIDAMELASHSKNSFSFRLTSETGQKVNTNGETWSLTIVIRYWLFIDK